MEEKKSPQVSIADLQNCISDDMFNELFDSLKHIENAFELATAYHSRKSFLSGSSENVLVNLLHSMTETLKKLVTDETSES